MTQARLNRLQTVISALRLRPEMVGIIQPTELNALYTPHVVRNLVPMSGVGRWKTICGITVDMIWRSDHWPLGVQESELCIGCINALGEVREDIRSGTQRGEK